MKRNTWPLCPFVATWALLALSTQGRAAEAYSGDVHITPLMKSTTTIAGQPIVYPKTDHPQVTAFIAELAPGKETGWHRHPLPGYSYLLSGTMSLEVEGQPPRIVHAGEAVAEPVDKLHNGRSIGTEPARILVFATGEENQPYSVKASAPPGASPN